MSKKLFYGSLCGLMVLFACAFLFTGISQRIEQQAFQQEKQADAKYFKERTPGPRMIFEQAMLDYAGSMADIKEAKQRSYRFKKFANFIFIFTAFLSAILLFSFFKRKVDTMMPRHRVAFLLIVAGILLVISGGFLLEEFGFLYRADRKKILYAGIFLIIAGGVLLSNMIKILYDWCLMGKNN